MRKSQLALLENEPKSYGGELLKTRRGRARGRPIDSKNSMHLVLRSTKAKGAWSLWTRENRVKVQTITAKFSKKYGVRILSMANVGNHLHFHVKLSSRHTYVRFIRAITSAIAMAVTGVSRWNPSESRFWDYRPFTRVVVGRRAFLNLSDYVQINRLEGFGLRRSEARYIWDRLKEVDSPDG